jgi:MFS transporter, DHA2 family, multidrug resistance protein
MFAAFFNLFGTLVLLPIYLQTLMDYTAFLAGVIIGPGGVASMIAMPVAGKLIEKRDPRKVLAVGVCLSAFSTYMMSEVNLQTDFWTLVWPRVVLGFGMGLLFIPLTTMTLSHIQKEKMADATAMYNLLRNIGGSVGVAFVTTLVARRAQFHQVTLTGHLTQFDAAYTIAREKVADWLVLKGMPFNSPDSVLYGELQRQAGSLAFNDTFYLLFILMLSVLPLILLMKRRINSRTPPPLH